MCAMHLRPQAANHIECACIDHAICPGTNIGFSHLRLLMRGILEHKQEGAQAIALSAEEQCAEAMAAHVFSDDGKILVTWLLRSVMYL